jgi:hypothetical protein
MEATKIKKLRFDNSGYYFIGMIGLVLLGFWPSYFAKFIDGTANFAFYFHFHATMISLWLAALIIQPILIKRKKSPLHRLIGKLTYFLFPLVILSIILLAHSRHPFNQPDLGLRLFVPFKDILIMCTAYFIAIRYRHNADIHARGMVATGIVFIEPALSRFLGNMMNGSDLSYFLTIAIIYTLLITLIILERRQKRGRWVFPLVLGMYIVVHAVLIFWIHIPGWDAIAAWFAKLPIT